MNISISLIRRVGCILAFGTALPSAMAIVLVSNFDGDSLVRFDGAISNVLVAPGSGGLSLPHRSRIAPDGTLLVASAGTDTILRYNLQDGSYLGEFISAAGGLDYPVDMVFHSDSFLYISSQLNNQILRFDSSTGSLDNTWSAAHADLSGPSGFVFDDDGSFYVSGRFSNNVVQFAADGTFLRSFGTVSSAFGMVLHDNGSLLVASGGNGSVEAFTDLDNTPLQNSWATGLNIPVGIEQGNFI